MELTLKGDPQEIMTLLTSLASNPHVIAQTAEQLPPPQIEQEAEVEQVDEPIVLPPVRKRERPEARPATIRDRVLAYVAENPDQGLAQIAEGLELSGKSISGRLSDLCAEKAIVRTATEGSPVGTYRVASEDNRPTILLPGPAKELTVGERTGLKWEILELLQKQGPMRVDRLRQNIVSNGSHDLSSNNLYARLGELHTDGLVARIPDASGKYIYRFLKQPA